MPIDEHEMRQNLTKFTTVLQNFAHSKENFRIISSISKVTSPTPTSPTPSTLYILDSSFNPPTLAHLRIATSALQTSTSPHPRRLLLLLATQNADKASKPASFAHRLVMMNLFAQDLLGELQLEKDTEPPGIDIGITSQPYFIDKAHAISTSTTYPSTPSQTHLIGFDTLTRLLSTKYYPPTHTLTSLTPFLSTHRLRVMIRPQAGDEAAVAAQKEYIRAIGEGSLDDVGGKREWRDRIEVVEGMGEDVSSTRVREAAKRGDEAGLRGLVTKGVAEWILRERLYLED